MKMDLLPGFLLYSPFSVVDLTPGADFPGDVGNQVALELGGILTWGSHLAIFIYFTLFLLHVLQLFLHPNSLFLLHFNAH